MLNAVLVDRERRDASVSPVDTIVSALDAGHSLIFFPEGTRNTTDEVLLPFRSGLFHIACRRPDVELVPVWMENLGRVLPKGEFMPVPLLRNLLSLMVPSVTSFLCHPAPRRCVKAG